MKAHYRQKPDTPRVFAAGMLRQGTEPQHPVPLSLVYHTTVAKINTFGGILMKKITIYEFRTLITKYNDFELLVGDDRDALGVYRAIHLTLRFNRIAIMLNGNVCLLGSGLHCNFSLGKIHDITMAKHGQEILFKLFCGDGNHLPVVIKCD